MALVGNCQNPPIRGVAAFAFGYLRHFSSEGLVVVVMMLELDFLYHGQYQLNLACLLRLSETRYCKVLRRAHCIVTLHTY